MRNDEAASVRLTTCAPRLDHVQKVMDTRRRHTWPHRRDVDHPPQCLLRFPNGRRWLAFREPSVVMLLLLLLLLVARANSLRLSNRVVNTKYGMLRGVISTLPNRNLQPVEAFLGVPYASPPVGSLRFMPPVTPAPWRGERVADRFGPACPQRFPDISNETDALRRMPAGRLDHLRRIIPYLRNQSEDCLQLNIYMPQIAELEKTRLPVLVFIHGESYEWNSGNPYDGRILASFGNIIVVTLNYRMGFFGFLPAIPGVSKGNYGLMDQVAALHWVQENIADFGGDPRNITVAGHGHGAACVHLLLLSPMAKGLFHRAILHSGSALSPWAIARESIPYTRQIARALGCPLHNMAAMVDCLRQQPMANILRVKLTAPRYLTAIGPTIDGTFVPDEPETMMKTRKWHYGDFDLLLGVTSVESYFHFSSEEEKHGISPERRDRLLRTLVRNLYSYHLREIFLTIVNEYTDWTRPVLHPVNILEGAANALGDALVVAPLVRVSHYHANVHKKVYFYAFTHQTENGGYPYRMGCIHGEELAYVFGAPLVDTLGVFSHNYTRSETGLSEAVMTYWSTFVKDGDPNVPFTEGEPHPEKVRGRFERFIWPQYDALNQKYVVVSTKPKVKDHYQAHRLSLWLNLIPSIHQPGDPHVTFQHHLLDNHDNPKSYDGIVRQLAITSPVTLPMTSPTPPKSPGEASATESHYPVISHVPMAIDQSPHTVATTPWLLATHLTRTTQRTASPTGITETITGYTSVFSLTIAVGCLLLILNLLLFLGIYHQREKIRSEMEMQHSHYQTANNICLQEGVELASNQHPMQPTRAPPPSPVGQPEEIPLAPAFVTQNPLPNSLGSIPPKVPPKPSLNHIARLNGILEVESLLTVEQSMQPMAHARSDTEEVKA